MKNIGLFSLIGLLGIIVLIPVFLLIEPYSIKGSEITTPVSAPLFSLPSSQGGSYVLKEHRGKIQILFFGYTYCPDICPTTLYKMKLVKEELGKLSDQVEIVFITVDPLRDTSEKLAIYLRSFDRTFYGLTGDENELNEVWNDYGVFRKVNKENESINYLVDHSTRIYLIDKNGNFRVTYLVDVPVTDLVSDIKFLLKTDK